MSEKRWDVTLTYRSENGSVDVQYEVEELYEVGDLVESGPDWNTLVSGVFSLNPRRAITPGLTLEAAADE
jgi:hypothetical protein